ATILNEYRYDEDEVLQVGDHADMIIIAHTYQKVYSDLSESSEEESSDDENVDENDENVDDAGAGDESDERDESDESDKSDDDGETREHSNNDGVYDTPNEYDVDYYQPSQPYYRLAIANPIT